MDELDELSRRLLLHGVWVVRVAGGVMVSLVRGTDAARAYVVVVSPGPGGERHFVWGPVRSMRAPVADVDGAALDLVAYLWELPVGHGPAAWPDLVRGCLRVGRLRWLRARIRAEFSKRLGERFSVGAGGRW